MHKLPGRKAILNDLIRESNFVDEPTCSAFIATHKKLGTLNSSSDNGLYLRLHLRDTKNRDAVVFQATRSIIRRIIKLIHDHYHEKVGCDLALICAITGNYCHTVHADNATIVCPRHGNNPAQLLRLNCACKDVEVRPNHTPWRKYTALLYLDNDHDGGNIVFGEGPSIFGGIYRKEIDVKRGLLVLSPSNELYHHRTLVVTRGVRYSMNMWFTVDQNHICPDWE
jgi:hypothetical protein